MAEELNIKNLHKQLTKLINENNTINETLNPFLLNANQKVEYSEYTLNRWIAEGRHRDEENLRIGPLHIWEISDTVRICGEALEIISENIKGLGDEDYPKIPGYYINYLTNLEILQEYIKNLTLPELEHFGNNFYISKRIEATQELEGEDYDSFTFNMNEYAKKYSDILLLDLPQYNLNLTMFLDVYFKINRENIDKRKMTWAKDLPAYKMHYSIGTLSLDSYEKILLDDYQKFLNYQSIFFVHHYPNGNVANFSQLISNANMAFFKKYNMVKDSNRNIFNLLHPFKSNQIGERIFMDGDEELEQEFKKFIEDFKGFMVHNLTAIETMPHDWFMELFKDSLDEFNEPHIKKLSEVNQALKEGHLSHFI